MSSSFLAMGIACIGAFGLIIGIGVLSLLNGGLHFLFARPKVEILKTEQGENGFAFGFLWNGAREPAKFDKVRVRLFNPFGSPTQVEVSREFSAHGDDFAEDLDMGPGMGNLVSAIGEANCTIEVEVISTKDNISHQIQMKGQAFLAKRRLAKDTANGFASAHKTTYPKPVYHTVGRSFIAEPLPASGKQLKLATNPAFAGDFQASESGDAGKAQENFAVTKVWIEEGCIVCNACEAIIPEVFEVTADSCIIRPGAPLDQGLAIQEAAEACPTEVIKFLRA